MQNKPDWCATAATTVPHTIVTMPPKPVGIYYRRWFTGASKVRSNAHIDIDLLN